MQFERNWSSTGCVGEKNPVGFDGHHADTILEVIRHFVSQLDNGTTISLWRQTETGMGDETADACLYPDSLRMNLEMELLREITNLAWEEAKEGTRIILSASNSPDQLGNDESRRRRQPAHEYRLPRTPQRVRRSKLPLDVPEHQKGE
jgi:hypothetical protein